jgi:hypothetical protein
LTSDYFLPGIVEFHSLSLIRDLKGNGDLLRHGKLRDLIEKSDVRCRDLGRFTFDRRVLPPL